MRLTAYARPRSKEDDFPGHIVIGTEGVDLRHFGYTYDLDSLPKTVPTAGEEFVQFFFNNAIPGLIVNSTNLVKKWEKRPEITYWKHVPWDGDLFEYVPISPDQEDLQFGNYSFDPDRFHSDTNPCYNCVKWAHVVTDPMVPGFIPAVENWRMKHIIKHLQLMSESPRLTHG